MTDAGIPDRELTTSREERLSLLRLSRNIVQTRAESSLLGYAECSRYSTKVNREGGRRKPTGNIRQRETYPCRDSPAPMDNRIITMGDKSLLRGLLAVGEVILPVSPP